MTLHDLLDFVRLFLFIPMRVFYWPFMLCPIKKKKIVFANFNGKGYGCSPKAICNALLNKDEDLDLVWLTKDRNFLPDRVRNVGIKSFRALYELATASALVTNNRLPYYVAKRKKQFYVQTWHGPIAFKQIESHLKNMPLYYKIRSKHDSCMMDILMTNSKWSTDYFRDCFWYGGEILEVGTARNDIIVNKNTAVYDMVRSSLGLPKDTKILLYAPTFRRNTDLNMFKLPFNEIIDSLESRFGGNWVSLVRLHPILASKSDFISYSKSVINATAYPDFQELLAAADYFITDYSSGLFDFIISRKPALFYAQDLEDYRKERDLALEPDILPCPLTKNEEELIKTIQSFDEEKYQKSLDTFFNYMGMNETGHASDMIADRIMDEINNRA